MIALLLFIVTFGAGAAMAAERQEAVPARFVGEWAADLKRCGADRDDSRLRLDADRIRFRESGGRSQNIGRKAPKARPELAGILAWNRPAGLANPIGFHAL